MNLVNVTQRLKIRLIKILGQKRINLSEIINRKIAGKIESISSRTK